MIESIKITAYRCPFCDYISINKGKVDEHAKSCCRNPEHMQKCINCGFLNNDFTVTSLSGKGICIPSSPYGKGCPYVNHDSTEVDLKIQQSHDAYTKYCSYNPSLSPQENWRKEEDYDRLRSSGVTADEAERRIYGE